MQSLQAASDTATGSRRLGKEKRRKIHGAESAIFWILVRTPERPMQM